MMMPGSGKRRLTGIVLALAGLGVSGAPAVASDDVPAGAARRPVVCAKCGKVHTGSGHDRAKGLGTLGYGPPGLHPGFQGFGLGYHLGYGYGGDALGVGVDGGYPFYGGPGYPRCDPRLRRIGGINPFPHFAGPGYPTPEHPNFYGGAGGPLVPDQTAITIEADPHAPMAGGDYGGYTGIVPDPEARFAPFTARAAAGTMSMRARQAAPVATPSSPTSSATPGAAETPATEAPR
jgi:hypothetical protein